MCYNYRPTANIDGQLINKYKLRIGERPIDPFSSYYSNGFNHEYLPIVTMERPDEIQFFNWGLVPYFIKDIQGAKDIRNKTLNARSESIFTTNSYKQSIHSKRCLIPANGFFEWHTVGKDKYPYYIMVDESYPSEPKEFCFGGIYNKWVDKETGEILNTFSIITTQGNDVLNFIHNSAKRMPLILHDNDIMTWLNPDLNESQITDLMKPYPSNNMVAYSISKLITARNQIQDDPNVLAPFDYELEAVPAIVSFEEMETLNT